LRDSGFFCRALSITYGTIIQPYARVILMNKILAFMVLSSLASFSAAAGQDATGKPASEAKQSITEQTIESLQSQLAVLKAELAVEKARSDIGALNKSVLSLPQIKSVYGVDNRVSATLTSRDGGDVVVAPGDRVAGYRVISIDRSGVVLGRGKERHALSFAQYQMSTQTSFTGTGGGLPLPSSVPSMIGH